MNRLESERLRIQAELDALRTQRARNMMGQFATPGPLAYEILQSARRLTRCESRQVRFLDPAFGTGSFYSALLRVFPSASIADALGFEIDPHYGIPASRLWESTGLRLKLSDFTTGCPAASGADQADLVVCNPPYVRHHHIERPVKLRLQSKAMEQLGIRVSGLAGLYVYFMLLSHEWLAADGLSIWLIPSEFMDVNYGSALKDYLLNHVDLIRIHRFDPSEGTVRRRARLLGHRVVSQTPCCSGCDPGVHAGRIATRSSAAAMSTPRGTPAGTEVDQISKRFSREARCGRHPQRFLHH